MVALLKRSALFPLLLKKRYWALLNPSQSVFDEFELPVIVGVHVTEGPLGNLIIHNSHDRPRRHSLHLAFCFFGDAGEEHAVRADRQADLVRG